MGAYDDITLQRDKYQQGWLDAYERKSDGDLWNAQPVSFLPKYSSVFQAHGIRTILEAGCGDGRNARYLLQQGFLVVGADISTTALSAALQSVRNLNLRDVCFVAADLERLPQPFPKHSFDALTCLDVFGQLLDLDQAISGFRNVVRPDGLVLLNLYTPDDASFGMGEKLGARTFLYNRTLFRFFSEDDIRELFKDFEIMSLERQSWQDPPHPGFRDDYHIHDSYVVLLRTPAI